MKGSFQLSLISILFILLGFCITELHWNYHWNYHSTLTLCNCTTRSDLNSLNGHYRSKYGQNYDIVTGTRNSSNPRICKYRYGRQRLSFNQLRVFNYRGLFDRKSLRKSLLVQRATLRKQMELRTAYHTASFNHHPKKSLVHLSFSWILLTGNTNYKFSVLCLPTRI